MRLIRDVAQAISNNDSEAGERLRENLYDVALKLKISQAETGDIFACISKVVFAGKFHDYKERRIYPKYIPKNV